MVLMVNDKRNLSIATRDVNGALPFVLLGWNAKCRPPYPTSRNTILTSIDAIATGLVKAVVSKAE